jgi:uncharacterized membrane protein
MSTDVQGRLRGALRGAVAGLAGTAAMTVAQTAFQQATRTPPSTAPAQGARKALRRATGMRVSRRRTPQLNLAAHFGYGAAWGAVYGAAARRPTSGVGFGAAVWGASLGLLPGLGLAPPVWRRDPRWVAPDVAFHVVYGVATAETDRALREPAAPSTARATLASLALGTAAGMRTFTPPAALALRRDQMPPAARWATIAAAAGEIVGDKHPRTPDRRSTQAIAGRLGSGMTSGWTIAGARGGVAGAAAAVTSALAMAAVRARLVEATGLPDPAVGVAEDLLAVGLSALAAAPASARPGDVA